jgi:excisionase family DNA binding protein
MKLLSTEEVAERLKLSPRRVRAMITSKQLDAVKIGKYYAIPESALSGVKVYGKAGRPKKAA